MTLGKPAAPLPSPFDLEDERSYRRWRDAKLAAYPLRADDALVKVRDPCALTSAEHRAMLERCRDYNFVVYASGANAAGKEIPRRLGLQFGLARLDGNWLADDDGITSLAVSPCGDRRAYIPYT